MIFEIISCLSKIILAKLPGWFVRYFYPPKKIADSIDIDLRNNQPVVISFGTDIPSVDLYFQIFNKSPFDLVLDRLLIDFWIGQPTFRGAILRRYNLQHGDSIKNVHFGILLSLPQQEQIKEKRKGQLISESVSITVTGYFESKLGLVCVEKRFDCADIPCRG